MPSAGAISNGLESTPETEAPLSWFALKRRCFALPYSPMSTFRACSVSMYSFH